jgi:nicotinamide phosphoribosyltransferase
MTISKSIVLNTDLYKYSQPYQYPKDTDAIFSYISGRGGKWDHTVFFGLQMFLREYLMPQITQEDIDYGADLIPRHGLPFHKHLWQYILDEHGGFLPLKIRAVPEGTLVPIKNIWATIEPTDPNCWWLVDHVESALLRGCWYPTAVSTNSYFSKRIIKFYLEKNGSPELLSTRLSDFGLRGVSSFESAGIGGAAHLVHFDGTDNVTGSQYASHFYNRKLTGLESIPAMQHSTVTSWGRDGEVESYRNMLSLFGMPGAIIACVSDSYNIFNACEKLWGEELKEEVINSGAIVVIRSDSGNPVDVLIKCITILDRAFGHTINSKGYKVLNNVRLFQSDGINQETISRILYLFESHGYSSDNIAFGQGGALLQQLDRDTIKAAMKGSARLIRTNGQWYEMFKDPITDQGKSSLRGRVDLFQTDNGLVTAKEGELNYPSALIDVFMNGKLLIDDEFETIQARVTF